MTKTLIIALVTLLFATFTFGQAIASNHNGNGHENRNPIRICHATDSHTNPYTNPTVDQDAVDGDLGNDRGQGDHYMEHNGPVWAPGIADHSWGDIIPPIAGVHAGKNWTAQGQAFWNNSCNIPGASPSPSPSVNPSPSVEPSPSVDPSPSTSPEPSDNPGTGGGDNGGPSVRHGVSFHNSDLVCDTDQFRAVFDAFNYGSPVSGTVVRFTFHGETKEATTNSNGRAEVTFTLKEGIVTATADGYGTYTKEIKEPVECQDIHIDPDTSKPRGQVLGATTLADTGSHSLYLSLILISLGAMVTSVAGYGVYQEAKA